MDDLDKRIQITSHTMVNTDHVPPGHIRESMLNQLAIMRALKQLQEITRPTVYKHDGTNSKLETVGEIKKEFQIDNDTAPDGSGVVITDRDGNLL